MTRVRATITMTTPSRYTNAVQRCRGQRSFITKRAVHCTSVHMSWLTKPYIGCPLLHWLSPTDMDRVQYQPPDCSMSSHPKLCCGDMLIGASKANRGVYCRTIWLRGADMDRIAASAARLAWCIPTITELKYCSTSRS